MNPIRFNPTPKQKEAHKLLKDNRIVLYGGAVRGSKLLPLDTPIPTPTGWTTMGDIKPNDIVFNANGQQTTVSWISDIEYQPKAWKLHFDDGSFVTCDEGHQWVTTTYKDRVRLHRSSEAFRKKRRENRPSRSTGKRPDLAKRNSENAKIIADIPDVRGTTKTTKQIIDTLMDGRFCNHAIVNCGVLNLPDVSLPIAPYTFGAWLGDGTSSSAGLTGIDPEIWDEIEKEGYPVTHHKKNSSHNISGIKGILREIGVLNNKHIPQIYLRSSYKQRLSLLQGLCDTDACCNKVKGSISFTTTSEKIKDGFLELVYSMGVKPSCRKFIPKIYGKECGVGWVIQFWHEDLCFRLKRKSDYQKISKGTRRHYRTIVRAEPAEPVPMRCIAVDCESHTYLCGKEMIPTHNSYWGCLEIISLCFQYPNSRWLMLRKSLPVIKSTLLKTFKENFLDKGFSAYVSSFQETSLVLTWNNKSQILFMSENYDDDKDLNRFKGLEINGAFIDEINEIQEVTFDKVIERAGSWFHSPGCPTKILASCNPAQNWVKKRFYDKWKEGKLPEGQAYIQARIYDNPYVPEDYLESLKLLPRYQYEVFVNGDWEVQLQTGNEFLSSLKTDKHMTGATYNPAYPVHVSLDSNVWPYVAITLWQIIPKGMGWIIRQIGELHAAKPDNRASKAGAKIVIWLTKVKNKERVHLYGDWSLKNANTIDDYGRSFFQIVEETIKAAGILTVDKMMPHASPSTIGDFINAILDGLVPGLEIEINELCKVSINDYITTKKDHNGNPLKEKVAKTEDMPAHEGNGHACFVGETMITTISGEKRIDNIDVGDLVLTRNGFRPVLNVYKNGFKSVNEYRIGGHNIVCTDDHKVFTYERGFYYAKELIGKSTFCIFEKNKICKKKLLFTMVKGSQDTRNQKKGVNGFIFQAISKLMESAGRYDCIFINICKKLEMCLRGIMCTMWMKMRSIMRLPIWNASRAENTSSNTCRMKKENNNQELSWKNTPDQPHVNGINQKMGAIGIKNMLNHLCLAKKEQSAAKSAARSLQQHLKINVSDFAAIIADGLPYRQGPGREEKRKPQNHVSSVVSLPSIKNSVPRNVTTIREVFDIEVADEHEYFANGVLVSNCDTFKDFVVQAFRKEYEAFLAKSSAIIPGGIQQHQRPHVRKTIG